MENDDVDMNAEDNNEPDFDDMDKRLKDIEDETATLKDMQAKVEKEKGSIHDLGTASAGLVNREEIDSHSVFVGNIGDDELGLLLVRRGHAL